MLNCFSIIVDNSTEASILLERAIAEMRSLLEEINEVNLKLEAEELLHTKNELHIQELRTTDFSERKPSWEQTRDTPTAYYHTVFWKMTARESRFKKITPDSKIQTCRLSFFHCIFTECLHSVQFVTRNSAFFAKPYHAQNADWPFVNVAWRIKCVSSVPCLKSITMTSHPKTYTIIRYPKWAKKEMLWR